MSEERLQSEVVKYIQLQYPKVKYCASLGGQYQPFQSQRNRARKTGYVKGFPDLFIYESRTINGITYHGLALEIKTIKGRATKEQKEWIEALNERGYKAVIVKGLPDILNCIDAYFFDYR
tara:strand:+ start:131 stop:490 length:360 start_codon:yes stop_codon:yes gene_type:complete